MALKLCLTEDECIKLILDDLYNWNIIVSRGDIDITTEIKKAALKSFKKTKLNPKNGLYRMSDKWFIETQLQGWDPIKKQHELPFGDTIWDLSRLNSC